MRAAGFRLVLDDFGTGYSSLSYLDRLPIDAVKVDRSFLVGAHGHGARTSIIRAIIGLATALEIDVVAEGIESPGQADFMSAMVCRLGQGYLLGRPQPL